MTIDKKEVVEGAPIVEAIDSAAFVFLRRDRALVVDKGVSSKLATPFGISGGNVGDGEDGGENPEDPKDPTDKPDLSDIEEITYEQYFDSYNSIRYNAILKVRNSSTKKDQVIGVDARNTPSSGAEETGTVGQNGNNFITPTPTMPSVVFDRTGTAIAWGWANSENLGSYTSVSYEWEIRATSATSGSTISSGTKEFASSGSFPIGDSGKNRRYRVSSGDGDTPATASSRWLRVRAVVVGTNGKTYYSRYSNPI
jgi:hypothetical protein